jgi:hypothetical protein
MKERKRRFSQADWLALQEISKHYPPKMGGNCRSVWLAMETLAWEQRKKHHGCAFVTSQDYLARVACIGVSTLKIVSAFLEESDLVTITRRWTSTRRRDFNHYALRYPNSIADDQLWNHSRVSDEESRLVLLKKGEASKCPAADAASPLALRHFDASHKKDIDEALAAKREAAAKYKAEQLAAAEERRRQEEAELAERKERERIERDQRLERLKLAAEKEKADKEAAERAEDARRLAMRKDVGSCVAAIHRAAFDEYNAGTLYMLLADYDRSTFDEAVGKLLPDMSDKVRACMKRNEWMFE